MVSISIIDYGMSNLLSICRGLEKAGGKITVISSPEEVQKSDRLVLPGVGAFPDGMNELHKRNLPDAIREHVAKERPFLGICLGMQMMLSKSYEINETKGLNLIEGEVIALPDKTKNRILNKVPHMGWSTIHKHNQLDWSKTILANNASDDAVYFVHSYYAKLGEKQNELSYTPFGDMCFTSAIRRNNCFGVQFHPEKSGEKGLKILKQFLKT